MPPGVPAASASRSVSTASSTAGTAGPIGVAASLRLGLAAAAAAWRAMTRERLRGGLDGYLLYAVANPVFGVAIAALVYARGRTDLLGYTVVAMAANGLTTAAVYYVGVLLDNERSRGTLVGLFLAPCPRAGWLCGYALVGLLDAALGAAATLAAGALIFGVRYAPDVPALLVSVGLLTVSLGGLGFVFSAIGLLTRRSSELANLVWPFALLLGGAAYPVALLPDWLQYAARLLPLGYGMQAIADAALHGASIADLSAHLLPLAGFAVVTPVIGVIAFAQLEKLARHRGELDLY